MRIVPGWVVGAAGAAVVALAFVLGGQLAAADVTPATTMVAEAAPLFELECEPGQRAVLRRAEAARPGQVQVATMACVGEPTAPMGYVQAAGYLQPAVVRRTAAAVPASVQRTSTARAPVVVKKRSTGRSVAIIAGSAAAGAVVGGVAKGKKGAVIGGIVGGAAATIWDQVTRRRSSSDR